MELQPAAAHVVLAGQPAKEEDAVLARHEALHDGRPVVRAPGGVPGHVQPVRRHVGLVAGRWWLEEDILVKNGRKRPNIKIRFQGNFVFYTFLLRCLLKDLEASK